MRLYQVKKFILMYNVVDHLRMIFTKDRMARGYHIAHILCKSRKSFLSNNSKSSHPLLTKHNENTVTIKTSILRNALLLMFTGGI